MDDSSVFMQWAVNTLQHQDPGAVADDDAGRNAFPSLQALRDASHADVVVEVLAEAHKANSWSSGDTGCRGGISPDAAMEQGGCWSTSANSGGPSAPSSIISNLPMGWNFSAVVSAQPSSGSAAATAAAARSYERGVPEMVYGSQPTRTRASAKCGASTGLAPSPYAQDHIMAERKRREKINQRFIELSTVIPGLKKMDKATILCDAARYVKELQERVKSLEQVAGSNGRSIETVVLVKKLCIVAPDDDDEGSPSPRPSSAAGAAPARNPLPEIEARFSENNVMVRIHCENGKGLVVRVLAEVEELHLRIVHSSVMPFTASTMIITITAKLEEGFTVTAEDIVGRLNSTLYQHIIRSISSSSSDNTEETRN